MQCFHALQKMFITHRPTHRGSNVLSESGSVPPIRNQIYGLVLQIPFIVK